VPLFLEQCSSLVAQVNLMLLFIELFAIIGISSFNLHAGGSTCAGKGAVPIEWCRNIKGDFSFAKQWSYPEGVYRNAYGQLSCDGFCPEEIELMKDSAGRIYRDSLEAFYKLIDTTHLLHTIQCDAWCYEWGGTDFITAEKKGRDTVECFTRCNASTHSSLHFIIANGVCLPEIELKSIVPDGNATYPYRNGYFKIDRGLFKNGILKAEFDLNFEHKENPGQKMYWKGRIYSKIQK
jgi:hypothetical protein